MSPLRTKHVSVDVDFNTPKGPLVSLIGARFGIYAFSIKKNQSNLDLKQ